MRDSITWKIGGEAGFGIMSAGVMLSKIYARSGYRVFCTNEYPSLIRGGLNLITVRISTQKVEAMNRDLNLLIALSKLCVESCKAELSENAIVVYDPRDYEWKESDFPKKVILMPVPLTDILTHLGAASVMRNTLTIGATLALIGSDLKLLSQMLTDQFKKKGETVINSNIAVAQAGYDYIKEHYGLENSLVLASGGNPEKLLIINGSEALGVAAVRAGLQFAAIYPMTPINSVIAYLADHADKYHLVYTQPEDEISGINMALGASVAGVRSMVATSGGGFALMVEAISLCGMIETPLVIDMGMRVGPATGMPTWSEQGDLDFIVSAGHGEFPRIVFAPGDAEEIFDNTVMAFNLADKYQIPVFILTDKYLNESQWCVPVNVYAESVTIDRGKLITSDLPDSPEFKRYNLDESDGVSPRSIPGVKNGNFIANSYEHTELGLVTEIPENRLKMAGKRLKKMQTIADIAPSPHVFGAEDADITFVNWGTTKGAILEAINMLNVRGIKANLIHYSWIYPFPEKASLELFAKSKRLVLVELNATGQLGGLIRKFTGIDIKEKILKFDGRPFYPEEIIERLSL